MAENLTPGSDLLLVMIKPDGVRRQCTSAETAQILGAWQSLVAWLRGSDPDELPHEELVSEVARKAALRMPRFPEYDINQWVRLARTLPLIEGGHDRGPTPLATVTRLILRSLRLRRMPQHFAGPLSAGAIEILYGRAESFQQNRDLLLPRLLSGPVRIETWSGERTPLALAAKFVIRRALTASQLSNLIHMEPTDDRSIERLTAELSR